MLGDSVGLDSDVKAGRIGDVRVSSQADIVN